MNTYDQTNYMDGNGYLYPAGQIGPFNGTLVYDTANTCVSIPAGSNSGYKYGFIFLSSMPTSVIEFYWVGSTTYPEIIINAGPSYFLLTLTLTKTNYTMKYGFTDAQGNQPPSVTTAYTGGIAWTSGDRIRIVKLKNNVYIQLLRAAICYNIGGFNNETLNYSGYGSEIAFQFSTNGNLLPVMKQLTEYSIPLWDLVVTGNVSSSFTADISSNGTQVVTNANVTTTSNVILSRVSGGSGSPAYVVSLSSGSFTVGNTARDTAIYNYVVLN